MTVRPSFTRLTRDKDRKHGDPGSEDPRSGRVGGCPEGLTIRKGKRKHQATRARDQKSQRSRKQGSKRAKERESKRVTDPEGKRALVQESKRTREQENAEQETSE